MKKKIIGILFVYLFISSSCSYDDISIENKLVGNWRLDRVTINGDEPYTESVSMMESTYCFFEDNTFDLILTQSEDKLNGTWQLKKNNSKLVIAFSGVLKEYTIEKINAYDLWLSLNSDDGIVMYKYKSSE